MVYLDTGSIAPAPGGTTGSGVQPGICYDANDDVVQCPADVTSDAQTYVTAQLQNMAQAYQAQTIANYQQYQEEEAQQVSTPNSPISPGQAHCQTDENGVMQCTNNNSVVVGSANYTAVRFGQKST